MNHYEKPGIAKAFAARVVALRIKLGLLKIKTAREYRDAIVKAAHSAFLDIK